VCRRPCWVPAPRPQRRRPGGAPGARPRPAFRPPAVNVGLRGCRSGVLLRAESGMLVAHSWPGCGVSPLRMASKAASWRVKNLWISSELSGPCPVFSCSAGGRASKPHPTGRAPRRLQQVRRRLLQLRLRLGDLDLDLPPAQRLARVALRGRRSGAARSTVSSATLRDPRARSSRGESHHRTFPYRAARSARGGRPPVTSATRDASRSGTSSAESPSGSCSSWRLPSAAGQLQVPALVGSPGAPAAA